MTLRDTMPQDLKERARLGERNGHGPEISEARSPARLGLHLTDMGNAERLVANHGQNVRYCYSWYKWLVWDGRRWAVDYGGEVERKAKGTARSIYAEATAVADGSERRAIAAHAARSEAQARIQAMILLARSEPGVPVRPDALDADPWLLNCENGTLDLRTGELHPHSREDLITKLAPVVFDRDAEAPTWETFLRRALPSEDLRRFVQRLAGYSLTGDVSEQILPFLHGYGANGKTTFLNALLAVAGDYGQQAAPDLLLAKQGGHPTELADLYGARLVATVEVEDGRRFAESLVKQLTGGDRIKARRMREDFWEFKPTHKVFLAANHKPEVRGTDHAIWRRIKLIPFNVTIPKEEQDPRLPEKLRDEQPGILAWAVRGVLDWQREGLGEPEEVRVATEGYRFETDVLARWINERCILREGTWATFRDLYGSYRAWCESSGERAETKTKFGLRLTERGIENGRGGSNVAIRRGITLRHDGDQDPSVTGLEADPTPKNIKEHEQAREPVNRVDSRGATINLENTCKTTGGGERVNSSERENDINSYFSSRGCLYPKPVNNHSSVNSADEVPAGEEDF